MDTCQEKQASRYTEGREEKTLLAVDVSVVVIEGSLTTEQEHRASIVEVAGGVDGGEAPDPGVSDRFRGPGAVLGQ